MTREVPVEDVFACSVPDEWLDDARATRAREERPKFLDLLAGLARSYVLRQYEGQLDLHAIKMQTVEWLVTDDPAEVVAFQPGDGCAACTAGNDQTIAYLKEHTGALVALANLKYIEVWSA